MALVPLKLKVGLKPNGYAKYPDFNSIDLKIRKGLDWSNYVDTYGVGVHYDKTSGHKENTVDSPVGQQWACVCVPNDFAQAAVAKFPTLVSIITEAEFADFYDNKAHAHEPTEDINVDVLNAIKAKEDLGLAVPEKADAIDPTNSAQGIRKNENKTWADFKKKSGVTIL